MTTSATRSPPGFNEVKRSEFSRVFGLALNLRLFALPIAAVIIGSIALFDGTRWRVAVFGTGFTLAFIVSVAESLRFKRLGVTQQAMELNLGLATVAQLGVSFVTGGVESPMMPLVLPLAFFWSLISSRAAWYDRAVVAMQMLAPWLFVSVAMFAWVENFNPRLFGGGTRSGHDDLHLVASALVFSVAVAFAHVLGRTLHNVFDSVLGRALDANEALRVEYAERSSSQVLLTAEIAHELKNPLASVKGLSSLLTQNIDARGTERLAVLRQEVDRMQDIIDAFLTFSRPLVPLSVDSVDLAALCREVASLHEGLAAAKLVTLRVSGTSAARCDQRKVRQILVNLVQNAVEASPARGEVVIRCENEGALARLEVMDRGPGLHESVKAKLFSPGVTSKPKGNGIGLTIARTLARQHGGDVTLLDREGGGCVAAVTLPKEEVSA